MEIVLGDQLFMKFGDESAVASPFLGQEMMDEPSATSCNEEEEVKRDTTPSGYKDGRRKGQ
jgi:hypothetical protein